MKRNIINMILIIIGCIWMAGNNSFSQTRTISGTIVDKITNEPIPYASVGVVGSFEGTATNTEGVFELKTLCLVNCQIKISTIGYRSQVVDVLSIPDTIKLLSSAKILQGVTVTSRNINAKKVIRKALRSIKKNYITEPFTMTTFYRQYTQEQESYTGLIEAAINVYKEKGYGKPKDFSKSNDKFQLTQLRRSFDDTHHVRTNRIKNLLPLDFSAYQSRFSYRNYFWKSDQSNFKRFMKHYSFEVDKISEADDEELYIISFKTSYDDVIETGKLSITSKTHAIVKYEMTSATCQGKIHPNCYQRKVAVQYKKFGDRYALFHVLLTTSNVRYDTLFRATHYELLNNQIELGKNDRITKKEISRKEMASIQYDSLFWANYTIIKANPVTASILKSLQNESGLADQFAQQPSKELKSIKFEEESITKLKSFMDNNTANPYYLIFWVSWDKSFFKEFEEGRPYIEKLKTNGVKFLFVSLDNNHEHWEKAIEKFPSEYSNHIRVGRSLDREKMFGFYGPSRSMFYKEGALHNARSPAIIPEVFEDVLKEHFK